MSTKKREEGGWLVSWTTRDESAFIAGLGTFTQKPPPTSARIAHLLTSYLRSLEHRRRWDGIEPIAVRQHAERRLAMTLATMDKADDQATTQ